MEKHNTTARIFLLIVGTPLVVAGVTILIYFGYNLYVKLGALSEGEKNVIYIKGDTVDSANEKKLVLLTGKANTDEVLTDSMFRISMNAIKLNRIAEMYQWKEDVIERTETRSGKPSSFSKSVPTVTVKVKDYSYSKVWSAKSINSRLFAEAGEHQNPDMKYYSNLQTAGKVTLGAFIIPDSLKEKMNGYEDYNLSEHTLPVYIKDRGNIYNNIFYIGTSPDNPAIGDIKIYFKIIKPAIFTILAMQSGNSLEPYTTSNGVTIEKIYNGELTVSEVFARARNEENNLFSICCPVAGLILFITGSIILLQVRKF
ncbi:MAG: TMEM43 family protein [Candidatus Eremiobacterota bacterium]